MNFINRVVNKISIMGFMDFLPDKIFLKIRFWALMGKWPDLKNPKTFNEKIQWLKLNERNPEYTIFVDKYKVRNHIKKVLGEEYLIPLLGVWDNVDDIDFDSLPEKFVLKCNHNSGGVFICRNKDELNVCEAKEFLRAMMKKDFYKMTKEWPYKDVKRKIIAEKFMVDESGTELKDYKVFCFNGEPKLLFVATNRPHDTRFDFFDTDFNHLPFLNGHPNAEKKIERPKGLEEMIECARKLSKGIKQVRIDFYDINGKVYFGEMTFFHWSGFVPFEPEEWDRRLGDMITL